MCVVQLCCSFVFHKILFVTFHLIHSAGLKLKNRFVWRNYDQKLFILCLILIVVCWAEEEHF